MYDVCTELVLLVLGESRLNLLSVDFGLRVSALISFSFGIQLFVIDLCLISRRSSSICYLTDSFLR